MPRTPAQDTPARRQVRAIDSVSRRLDQLDDNNSQARVISWLQGLVDDGDEETVGAEIKAMREIARQFQTLDRAGRESIRRWVNENYAGPDDADGNPDNGDGPRPL